jgi:hypothetical protein
LVCTCGRGDGDHAPLCPLRRRMRRAFSATSSRVRATPCPRSSKPRDSEPLRSPRNRPKASNSEPPVRGAAVPFSLDLPAPGANRHCGGCLLPQAQNRVLSTASFCHQQRQYVRVERSETPKRQGDCAGFIVGLTREHQTEHTWHSDAAHTAGPLIGRTSMRVLAGGPEARRLRTRMGRKSSPC